MSNVRSDLVCERCGQEASGIAGCPDKPSGNCLFEVQWKRRKSEPLKVGAMLIFFLFFFGACGMWKSGWLLLIVGLATILVWALSSDILLYNAKSRTKLQRTTLAGVETSHTWTERGRLLSIRFEPSQPVVYPVSITFFATISVSTQLRVTAEQAAAVFRAALIDLLAKECIEVYFFQSYIFKIWQSTPSVVNNYIILAAQNQDQTQYGGVLETRIMRAIGSWWAQSEAKEWMDGPPIYDLVRSVYEKDRPDAAGWLAKLVKDDAVARGLCRVKKAWFSEQVEWDAASTRQFQSEEKIAQALSRQLEKSYLEFSSALDKQILNAINSRQESDGD